MRASILLLSVLALAACNPPVPESGAGVGFESYADYLHSREAQLNGATAPVPTEQTFSTERVGAAIDAAQTGQTTADVGAPLTATRPRGNAPVGIAVQTGEMAAIGATGISDEQDFDAVASRETIESDKVRLEQQRAQYQVVQPTALPERSGSDGPSIVEYALNTTNLPGEAIYPRSIFAGKGGACGRYTSADLAQEAFLKSGGPKRDMRGLDPDGDGFACGWDPRPFRAALR